MKKTNMTGATLALLSLLSISLLSTKTAQAQANLAFSGGSGTPLTITLLSPVTYTITTAPLFKAAYFMFRGDAFPNNEWTTTSTITYSINGGAAQSLNHVGGGLLGGDIVRTDIYTYGALFDANVGDTVLLSAGAMTTLPNFAAPALTDGVYSTFLVDAFGNKISSVAAPEPTTLALIVLGSGSMGFITRLRRNKRAI